MDESGVGWVCADAGVVLMIILSLDQEGKSLIQEAIGLAQKAGGLTLSPTTRPPFLTPPPRTVMERVLTPDAPPPLLLRADGAAGALPPLLPAGFPLVVFGPCTHTSGLTWAGHEPGFSVRSGSGTSPVRTFAFCVFSRCSLMRSSRLLFRASSAISTRSWRRGAGKWNDCKTGWRADAERCRSWQGE
jgi:hypothetical protein